MEPNQTKVSVLLSVHNGEAFLPQAVESILHQTFSDLEFIIVDDGSTDGTARLLANIAARDRRVRVHSRPNQGLTRSLNEAARLAHGQYLARMDADDVSLLDRLEQQVRHLDTHPACVTVGGQALLIDADGCPLGHWTVPLDHDAIDRHHLAGIGGGIIHPAALIRRDAFDRLGGYDVSLPAAQDYDLWLRLAEVGQLANLPHRVLLYRLHLQSVTATHRTLQTDCMRTICARARQRRGSVGLPQRLRRHYPPLSPCRQRLQWVRLALKAGFHHSARKHARLACSQNPFHPEAWLHLLATMFAGWIGRPREQDPSMQPQPHPHPDHR